MSSQRDELGIVKAIVALAHNLKLDIIAEGVEHEQQLSMIYYLDCAYGQGFLFSKAIATDDVSAWIESNKIQIKDLLPRS